MKRSDGHNKAGLCLMVFLLASAMQGQVYAHGGGGHGGGGRGGGGSSGNGNHGHGGFGHGHGFNGHGGGAAFVGGVWFLGGYAPGAYYYDDTSPWAYGPAPAADYVEIPDDAAQQGEPSWYYCENPAGYYPYVKQCASGWQRVVPYGPPPRLQIGPGTY
jgi:hypothetical protein